VTANGKCGEDVISGWDNVVGQETEERPTRHSFGCHADGMAKAEGLMLDDGSDLYILKTGQRATFAEMIFDQVTGRRIDHDDDLVCSSASGLLHRILDGWTINHGY
jgi:hypothetical protein